MTTRYGLAWQAADNAGRMRALGAARLAEDLLSEDGYGTGALPAPRANGLGGLSVASTPEDIDRWADSYSHIAGGQSATDPAWAVDAIPLDTLFAVTMDPRLLTSTPTAAPWSELIDAATARNWPSVLVAGLRRSSAAAPTGTDGSNAMDRYRDAMWRQWWAARLTRPVRGRDYPLPAPESQRQPTTTGPTAGQPPSSRGSLVKLFVGLGAAWLLSRRGRR